MYFVHLTDIFTVNTLRGFSGSFVKQRTPVPTSTIPANPDVLVQKFIENVCSSTRQLSYNKTFLCEILSKVMARLILTYLSRRKA